MSKERRQALGIFLSVMILACNYSPLTQEILDRSVLPARAEAASAQAHEGRILIPGGQAVGVALKTRGVLVVGAAGQGNMKTSLRTGDVIVSAAGSRIESTSELSRHVGAWQQEQIELGVLRDGRQMTIKTSAPVSTDGKRRLGVWVRDSTAGVGTLSYVDPMTNAYGALGHAIVDADTGDMLSVADGAILRASVVGVTKGKVGQAGELRGSFLKENDQIGTLLQNSVFGIYGCMESRMEDFLYPDGLPVATRKQVHPGSASIISTIDEEGPKEYSVEILRCFAQDKPSQKGMILQVTDERLLAATGGIVQGMSGSPIIQDGKLVGAVTHVLVNDPTKGYGIFIENMLDAAE